MMPGAGPPSQMISGPDLGAGFLHQLSMDGDADPRTFTYHAQDGGADANGPPKGPLDALGFAHPPSACMFGGPRCWHRSFRLALTDTPRVRLAYNRNRFVLQAMIDQAHAGAVADVPGALGELLERVGAPLQAEGVAWYIGGSTGAWLQGAQVVPHDIDLGTSPSGVGRLGELLAPYMIEPVAPTEWLGPGPVCGGRAFVGTFEKGARVEWSVPVGPTTALPMAEFGPAPEEVRTVTVTFGKWPVRASRPEYALVRASERGRTSAAGALAACVRERGPDLELLEVLLGRSRLSESGKASVRASIRG
ncbi:MAG TPA: hypothetical protein VK455_06705 [Thermoplasmata archaeon]|nr:hypothetical protein [Thermoplasmata archaeon]